MSLFVLEERLPTHQIGGKAPHAERDSTEVARALSWHCYSCTGNGGLNWCLSCSPSSSVAFATQDKALDVAGLRLGLATTRTLYTCYLNWELGYDTSRKASKIRFSTSCLYTPIESTHFHSIPNV